MKITMMINNKRILNKDSVTFILPATLCITIGFAYMFFLDYITVPWTDEVGTADTPINFVTRGQWISSIWHYTYNQLHAYLYVIWFKIFGVSRLAVCSMDIVISCITILLLLKIMIYRLYINNMLLLASFVFLVMGGLVMMHIIMSGRIDPLAILFATLLIETIIEKGERWKVFVYSFLLFASATYPIPLIGLFIIYLLISDSSQRGHLLYNLFLFVAGVLCSLFVICCLFKSQGLLYTYLYSFFFHSSHGGDLIHKFIGAYTLDIEGMTIFGVAIFTSVVVRKRITNTTWKYAAFMLAIPALMVLSGRYVVYYTWLFYLPVSMLLIYMLSVQNSSKVNIGVCLFSILFLLGIALARYQKNIPANRDILYYHKEYGNQKDLNFVFMGNEHPYYVLRERHHLYFVHPHFADHQPTDERFVDHSMIYVKRDMGFDPSLLYQKSLAEIPYHMIPANGYLIMNHVKTMDEDLKTFEKVYGVKTEFDKKTECDIIYKYTAKK